MSKKKLTIQQALSNAQKAEEQGKTALALKIYMAILKTQPSQPDAKNALRKLQNTTPRKHSGHKISKRNPSQSQINFLADLYKKDKLSETENACRKLLVDYPDAMDIMNLLGVTLARQLKIEGAVEIYEQAIKLKPDFPDAYLNLAGALLKLGEYKAALKKCRKCITLRSDFAEAHCVLGDILRKLGQFPESMRSYKKCLQLKPGYKEAYDGLGNVYLNQGLLAKGLNMKARAQHVICFDPNKGVSVLERI